MFRNDPGDIGELKDKAKPLVGVRHRLFHARMSKHARCVHHLERIAFLRSASTEACSMVMLFGLLLLDGCRLSMIIALVVSWLG